MWWIQLASAATLEFVVDTPALLGVGEQTLAQVFDRAIVQVERPAGPTVVTVRTVGRPKQFEVVLSSDRVTRVNVSADGVTVGAERGTPPTPAGRVRFKATGTRAVQLRWGEKIFSIEPGSNIEIDPPSAESLLEVRSADGMTIFSRNFLRVEQPDAGVVVVGHGRPPQIVGRGLKFDPSPQP